MLVTVNVPTTSGKCTKFYEFLLEGRATPNTFETKGRSAYFRLDKQVFLNLSPRKAAEERVVCYFEVPDLQVAIAELERLGGSLIVEPFPIEVNLPGGPATQHAAILGDPDGNGVGVVAWADGVPSRSLNAKKGVRSTTKRTSSESSRPKKGARSSDRGGSK